MSELGVAAKQLAAKGRNGDTTLLHVNKRELRDLESLLGEITRNPETGLPEAFSWKKLLAGLGAAGLVIAAIPTGGASLLGAAGMMSGIGAGTATALGLTGAAALAGKALKKSAPPAAAASDAAKYADERAALRKKDHYQFAPPMTMLQSLQPPDLLGRSRNNYIAPMGARNPIDVDGYAQGGVVTEEDAKKQVLAMLAQMQSQQQQGMAHGRMVKGAGAGLSDSIPANLSDGEYVMPADVVSMMGDGSTDAGGRKLDGLVAKVRMEKTGTKKQAGKLRGLAGVVR